MNSTKGSYLKLPLALLAALAYVSPFNSELLAQTPTPAAKVSPGITPVPSNNSNPNTTNAPTPAVSQPSEIDSSQLNLLETKITNLETKLSALESQPNSQPLIPILLSGLAGALLGSVVGGLLLRKIPFFNDSSKESRETGDRDRAEKDATIQYLNATISHISTTVKNLSERVKEVETELSGSKIESKESLDTSAVDFPTFNPDAFLQDRELPTAELKLRDLHAIPELVATYNSDPNALFFKGIEVVETAESLSNRRLSGNQLVVFENKRNGDYLIVKEKRLEYLIPKPDLQVDEDKYWLLETVFECRNYATNYSYFRLVEPARVLGILGGVNWSLEQKGILEFYQN